MPHGHDKGKTPPSQFEESSPSIEMYFNSIFNYIKTPLLLKDEEYRPLPANDAFCRMFGLNRGEVIGKTLAEKVLPNEQEHFLSSHTEQFSKLDHQDCYEYTPNYAKY